MGSSVSSLSVNQPVAPEVLDKINELNTARQNAAKSVQDMYLQYERCLNEHPFAYKYYCRLYPIQLKRLQFDHQYLTHQYDMCVDTNNLWVRPKTSTP